MNAKTKFSQQIVNCSSCF